MVVTLREEGRIYDLPRSPPAFITQDIYLFLLFEKQNGWKMYPFDGDK